MVSFAFRSCFSISAFWASKCLRREGFEVQPKREDAFSRRVAAFKNCVEKLAKFDDGLTTIREGAAKAVAWRLSGVGGFGDCVLESILPCCQLCMLGLVYALVICSGLLVGVVLL